MKKINVDYNNSLISVSNSLIKYYGNKIHHQTLKLLDNEFNTYPDNSDVEFVSGI